MATQALEPYKAMDINPSDTLWGQYMWSNHMAVIDRIRELRADGTNLARSNRTSWQTYDNQLAALGMLSAAQTWDDMGKLVNIWIPLLKISSRMGSKRRKPDDPILVAEFKSLGGQIKMTSKLYANRYIHRSGGYLARAAV